jgi:hypothetical protein
MPNPHAGWLPVTEWNNVVERLRADLRLGQELARRQVETDMPTHWSSTTSSTEYIPTVVDPPPPTPTFDRVRMQFNSEAKLVLMRTLSSFHEKVYADLNRDDDNRSAYKKRLLQQYFPRTHHVKTGGWADHKFPEWLRQHFTEIAATYHAVSAGRIVERIDLARAVILYIVCLKIDQAWTEPFKAWLDEYIRASGNSSAMGWYSQSADIARAL